MKRRRADDGEPRPEGEDWIEWGGESILSFGFTEGGAPFGLTVGEFRKANAESEPRSGWAIAKSVLQRTFRERAGPGTAVEVGWVTKVGDGLSRSVFGATVSVDPDPGTLSGEYAVLLPDRGAGPEDHSRWSREPAILRRLTGMPLPFRVPEPVGVFPGPGGPVLVRRYLDGIPADLRAGRMSGIRPAELVARIAAAIHRIDAGDWPVPVPGSRTRRAHGEETLGIFRGLEGPELRDARDWAEAHLPPARPACLVHGDLLGQNILIGMDAPPAVIDWEFCRLGDPAYDLAIVTRGVRRPFQMVCGLDRLLDAYAEAGGEPMGPAEVHFHEICLAAGWHREAITGRGPEPPQQTLARIHGILRRATGAAK